jgi:hypothetical protein
MRDSTAASDELLDAALKKARDYLESGKEFFGGLGSTRRLTDLGKAMSEVSRAARAGLLSENVRRYLDDILLFHAPRKRASMDFRNEDFVRLIKQICEEFGLNPTRNPAFHGTRAHLSGCAIVTMALNELGENVAESTVAKIWQNRTKE